MLLALLMPACYRSHGVPASPPEPPPDAQIEDAHPPDAVPDAELPDETLLLSFGVSFDAPTGSYREIVFTASPLPCEAVLYSRPGTTGQLVDAPPLWMSLVGAQGSPPYYVLHSRAGASGPAPCTHVEPVQALWPTLLEQGETYEVTWRCDDVPYGDAPAGQPLPHISIGAMSAVTHCGVMDWPGR